MNVVQLLDQLAASPEFRECVTAWERIPATPAVTAPFPETLDPRLRRVLQGRGITTLYAHQATAIGNVQAGRHTVVVTPTASGKTLCYNLPVLNAILAAGDARALYLFPTKALAQDQMAELHSIIEALDADIKTYTYDGDTPQSARKAIRAAGHIVVTNPDMLHTGILPHHTKWVRLFENLRYVVIDEVHHYRGVFGSHLANVIRRLKRICNFYGSAPVFICCSATIANPDELVRRLIGEEIVLVDDNGAPRGEKHFIFYNPPVVNRQLGIRKSSLLVASSLARNLVLNGIQTIAFARSRLAVEVLTTYLKEAVARAGRDPSTVRGYRGGYLPLERREIERSLRDGTIRAVVSTSALELGIDIGQLDASIMVGYPGTVASAWQQAGRAGRRAGTSLAVYVASSNPLDQYIVTHPQYFFGRPPEHALINPDNILILVTHLKCAAFELPFTDGEAFGVPTTPEMLSYLEEAGILRHSGNRWYWSAENFPADEVSLRSASRENFVIVDTTGPARVIGEVDRFSAPMLLHEEAIYLHGSEQYQVEKLDYDQKKAFVRRVDVDYYTDANLAVTLKVLDVFDSGTGPALRGWGEVMVTALATMFKKIKFHSHENVGSGPIHLPEEQVHTTAYWVSFPEPTPILDQATLEAGLLGVANLIANIAPLFLMCDPRDIGAVAQIRAPFTGQPTVYVYETSPGGVGFSEKMYALHQDLLRTALELAEGCACDSGCPSCVGPVHEIGERGKAAALAILREVLGHGPA